MNRSERHTTPTAPRYDDGPTAMRKARPDDERALERLAQLDSHPPLEGPVLVAEVAGELRAARSLGTGETIADPLQPTAHLRDLLSTQALQMGPSPRQWGRFAIRWWRLYARAEAR
jgi:hypothetical protein